MVPHAERQRFDAIVRGYTRGKRYDALFLLSGGKDSAYLLHRMRTEYPDLKLLCVTVNNGFMSSVAVANAHDVAERFQTDLLVHNASIGEFARVLRDAFLSLNGCGSYGVVDKADGDLIFATGRALAREMGIPAMIAGLSWVQLEQIMGITTFEMTEPAGPHSLFPLAVWRTGEQEIRQAVRDLRLMRPGSDSPVVSNSELILAMSVIDVLTLGYSSFEPEFAQLVREGKTDRQVWLHTFELLEFAATRGLLNKDLRRGLSKLGLTPEDVMKKELP